MNTINVALIGLSFGGNFLPIYTDHPNVNNVSVFDTDPKVLKAIRAQYPTVRIHQSFEEILQDPTVDAVHLVTPIPCHAEQTVAVLESGKHCACTVPMATSLEDLERIIRARRRSGKNYMMMETTLYTYQFFYLKEMIKKGELGKIQFMRGSHYQDMRGWPEYWKGLPPFWYGTHALAPMRMLAGTPIKRVVCFGSGNMSDELRQPYGNPFPVESMLLEFENGMKGEATRSLFETARAYQEGLFVYGSKACFEWGFADRDDPYITTLEQHEGNKRGAKADVRQIVMPNPHHLLPESIRKYTVSAENFDPQNPQASLRNVHGGGHHGSHPHLVHEFVRSIIEARAPAIDEMLGANITAAGICAHASAINGGESTPVPDFE